MSELIWSVDRGGNHIGVIPLPSLGQLEKFETNYCPKCANGRSGVCSGYKWVDDTTQLTTDPRIENSIKIALGSDSGYVATVDLNRVKVPFSIYSHPRSQYESALSDVKDKAECLK